MPVDAPKQIDLSQDLAGQGITLTTAEQNSFQDYLNTLKAEEKVGIIYLTKGEMQKLKDIVQTQLNTGISSVVRSSMKGGLATFIEEQKTEGLSLSDIIYFGEHTEKKLIENMNQIIGDMESVAQEELFGDKGTFSNLDLSPRAQDSLTVAFGVSMMQKASGLLGEKIPTNGEDLSQEMLANFSDIASFTDLESELKENFASIKSVIDKKVSTPGGDIPNVSVPKGGELNQIFMDPQSGVEFFNGVIDGTINGENVEETIEDKNVDSAEAIQIDLGKFTKTANAPIQELVGAITTAAKNMTPEDKAKVVAAVEAAEKDGKELTGFAKFIHDFIKGFINMFKEHTPEDTDKKGEKKEGEKKAEKQALKIPATQVETTKATLLEKSSRGAFTGIQKKSLQTFLDGEGNMEKYLTLIQDLPTNDGQDTIDKKIQYLLFSEDKSGTPKLISFIEAGSLKSIKNEDGTLNSKNLIDATTSYKNYRIAYEQNKKLTFEDFFTNSNE